MRPLACYSLIIDDVARSVNGPDDPPPSA